MGPRHLERFIGDNMDKENIFTTASVQDEPVDQVTLKSLASESLEESKIRQLIRKLVKECYGWPVDKEVPLYGVKGKDTENSRDPKNADLKLPKGPNTRSGK